MSITLVQSFVGDTYQSGGYAFPSSNTAGNFLLMVAANEYGMPTSCTDTAGNTWHQAVSHSSAAIWYAMNCAAGANTVKLSPNYTSDNNSTECGFTFYEFSGIATTSALDQTNSGSGSASISVTTTANGELVFASLYLEGTPGGSEPSATVTGSYTAGQDFAGQTAYPTWFVETDEWQVQSSSGSISTSFSSSGVASYEGLVMASFFAASASTTSHLLGCLGAGS